MLASTGDYLPPSEERITIGLIDSIIASANALKGRPLSSEKVLEALSDLKSNQSLKDLLSTTTPIEPIDLTGGVDKLFIVSTRTFKPGSRFNLCELDFRVIARDAGHAQEQVQALGYSPKFDVPPKQVQSYAAEQPRTK